MPILHNVDPLSNKDDQFEIYQDGEPLDLKTVKEQLPEDFEPPTQFIDDEEDRDVDINGIISQENNQAYRADVSQFKLLRVIGQGSFGKVYMVLKHEGPGSGKYYAMKVLQKASLKETAFQTEGRLYLILDLVKGGDLFTRLSCEVMFTEQDAKFYLAELGLALGHLHQCGIIYRDLKPENILLGADGHIKLTDFGLCKESIYDESKTYSFCGTIEYMAPEVVTRKGHGPAADWWSYGVLMYEMLTGTLPFHSSNKRETMNFIINARLGMPNFLSPSAQKLLRVLFKRVPQHRLGYEKGFDEFKVHPFFENIDFEKLLRKEVKPPFIPTLSKIFTCIENWKSQANVPESPLIGSEKGTLFKGFSFVAPLSEDELAQKLKFESTREKDTLNGFLPIRKSNIEDDYLVGEGSYSKVYRAIGKANKITYAIKVIKRERRNFTEEIEILLRFSEHPNIATLRDVYETEENYFLVFEYMRGGELLDRINKCRGFSEKEVAYYLEKLASTIAYLHEHGVVHRDIQPSNIMFSDESYRPEFIRLTDFGFAKQIRADNGLLMTPCFTANFVAPEVLKKQGYDQACDIWSLGIIAYVMLSGNTPFLISSTDSTVTILEKVISSEIDLESGIWNKDLIKGMLNLDPSKRLTADEVCAHRWIKCRDELSEERLHTEPQKIKSAMKAIFSALQKTSEVKPLSSSVDSSSLLQRRKKKNENKPIAF